MTDHNKDLFKLIEIKRKELALTRNKDLHSSQKVYMELLTMYAALDVKAELE